MDKSTLIKNLALAFIPLLVFIGADEFFCRVYGETAGTRYALFLAIGIGVAQTLFIFVKERRVDKMVLFDTSLIVIMGGVSLVSGDDIFFKLKPALVEFLMVIVLGLMTFVRPELLMAMASRYLEEGQTQKVPLKSMQRSLAGMLGLFLVHTILIVYAAFYLSKAAWGFISGGLLYILIAAYFLFIFILGQLRRRQSSKRAG